MSRKLKPKPVSYGAFARDEAPEAERVELTDRERSRRRIRDIVAVEYSYEEILQISALHRREMELRAELVQMFRELDGNNRLYDAIVQACMRKLEAARERRRKWYERNRQRACDYERERRKGQVGDEIRKRDRQRYAANATAVQARRTELYLCKPEPERARIETAIAAIKRKWYERNRDKVLAKKAACGAEQRARKAAYDRERYQSGRKRSRRAA